MQRWIRLMAEDSLSPCGRPALGIARIRVNIRRERPDGGTSRRRRRAQSGMNPTKTAILAILALLACGMSSPLSALAEPPSPFKNLPGRWVGEGRIGLGGGKIETGKCRAAHFLSA